IVSQVRFDIGMTRVQDESRKQQKREQMYRINSSKAGAQELKIVAFGESLQAVQIVEAEDETGQQEKQIHTHVSRFVERAKQSYERKEGRKAVAEMKEHDKDSSNSAYAGKTVEHFEELLLKSEKGRNSFSIAQS